MSKYYQLKKILDFKNKAIHVVITPRRRNTKRSLKVRARINKIIDEIDSLNTERCESYELGYRGKHHRICLLVDGQVVAIGLQAIEEHFYYMKHFKEIYLEEINKL